MLEEGSFRGRTADFVFMFLFGGFLMTVSFGAASGSLVSPDMVWTCRACLQPPCPGCAVEQGPPEQHSWFVNPLGASGQRASCPRPAPGVPCELGESAECVVQGQLFWLVLLVFATLGWACASCSVLRGEESCL